jgi:hypothetical protein
MPNPVAGLPVEIFDLVLDHFADDCNVRSYANLCLVDRQWYAACITRLYSRWDFDGDKHAFKSLF